MKTPLIYVAFLAIVIAVAPLISLQLRKTLTENSGLVGLASVVIILATQAKTRI